MVKGMSRTLTVIAGVVTALMMLHVTLDVASRNLLNAPITGTLEWTAYVWMPLIGFLAMAGAASTGEHLRVMLLVGRLPDRHRRIVDAVARVLMSLTAAVLAWFLFQDAMHAMRIGQASIGSGVAIPIWPAKYIAVVGLVWFAVQALVPPSRDGSARAAQQSDSEVQG